MYVNVMAIFVTTSQDRFESCNFKLQNISRPVITVCIDDSGTNNSLHNVMLCKTIAVIFKIYIYLVLRFRKTTVRTVFNIIPTKYWLLGI